MTVAKIKREKEIAVLATQVLERTWKNKGGSVALIPATTMHGKTVTVKNKKYYVVHMDEYYNPVDCSCTGGAYACKHKMAAALHFAPLLERLLDNNNNPRVELYRSDRLVVARLSQFTSAERAAFEEWKEAATRFAAAREAYNSIFDPNYANKYMYA